MQLREGRRGIGPDEHAVDPEPLGRRHVLRKVVQEDRALRLTPPRRESASSKITGFGLRTPSSLESTTVSKSSTTGISFPRRFMTPRTHPGVFGTGTEARGMGNHHNHLIHHRRACLAIRVTLGRCVPAIE